MQSGSQEVAVLELPPRKESEDLLSNSSENRLAVKNQPQIKKVKTQENRKSSSLSL